MCFLALAYRLVPGYPVVLAANRDERLDRPGLPPQEISPNVWAGVDPVAGGTWLGVNRHGRVVAVANVRSELPLDGEARSRGLACLDMLRAPYGDEPVARIQEMVRRDRYNPFNLLVADTAAAWIATFEHGRLLWREAAKGVHVIGKRGIDSPPDAKVARGHALIKIKDDVESSLTMLSHVCRDHGQMANGEDAICVHGAGFGTLSSTLMAVHDGEMRRWRYLHAEGHPCSSRYSDDSEDLCRRWQCRDCG